jgi:outer membrane protein
MKKIILSILMFIPLGIMAQEQKIAVVNTQSVFLAMPEIPSLESEMANTRKQYETEMKMMQDDYSRKTSDLIAQGDSLTENIKTLRLQELQDIQTRLENFAPMANEQVAKKQRELIAPIEEKIQKAIKEVGAENGYAYILINDPQIILFAGSGAIDATDKVKAKLGIK